MTEPLSLPAGPELIFGLVAPIGVDLSLITDVLDRALQEMDYRVRMFRLTELMREVPTGLPLAPNPYIQSYRDRIAYANEVRRQLGDDALAVLSISAIRTFRAEERKRRANVNGEESDRSYEPDSNESAEELPSRAKAILFDRLRGQRKSVCFGAYTVDNSF